MNTFLEYWSEAATALFAQALAGGPQLVEISPAPVAPDSCGWAAVLVGERTGTFSVVLEPGLLDSPLLGEGHDQKAGWIELLREVAEAAAGEVLSRTGVRCRVEKMVAIEQPEARSRAFQIRTADHVWRIWVADQVSSPRTDVSADAAKEVSAHENPTGAPARGVDLLLDIELEASLRFGCRELPLGEILDLGAGDVVQLDRDVTDPVDLIVADKIVARGEVVLVNGHFGLRVTEVATPRKRLESIRCLF